MRPTRLLSSFILSATCVAATPSPAVALPSMIRLGYTNCAVCHISPQGGGLLTTYGHGVDEAQSLRSGEYKPPDALGRFVYDVRFVAIGTQADDLSGPTQPSTASTYELMFRSSAEITAHNRLSLTLDLRGSPFTDGVQTTPTATGVVVPLVLWEYRPKDGLDLAVGRDQMPSGIGLPATQSYLQQGTDPGSGAYPTQVKLFWWNRRFQLTPYAFGPGNSDVDSRDREWGEGMLGGIDVWRQNAILGLSVLDSRASAFERRSVGAYARLGFGLWGILAEHELAGRTITDGPGASTTYIAGYTEVFVAPYEWLVASLAVDELAVSVPANPGSQVYGIAPGAQVRVSEHLTVVFTTRDVFADADAGVRRSRTYTLQLAVKTVR
jgi:hypothetical protein